MEHGVCPSYCKNLLQTRMRGSRRYTEDTPYVRARLQLGCGYFSPSPCPDHRCKWYQAGKMEGVPDPSNPQLPPTLQGGTRSQCRLTQPTAGTGLQPAWPWDQRSMEVADSPLRAPPPCPALQLLLPPLINQPSAVVCRSKCFFSPIYRMGCLWPGVFSERRVSIEPPVLSILRGKQHVCLLAAIISWRTRTGSSDPKRQSHKAGNHFEIVTGRSSAEACNELCPVRCSVLAGQAIFGVIRSQGGHGHMHNQHWKWNILMAN